MEWGPLCLLVLLLAAFASVRALAWWLLRSLPPDDDDQSPEAEAYRRRVGDFGKIRIYRCGACDARPRRPLRGQPKPCDRCGADLTYSPYQINDARLATRDLLNSNRDQEPDR